MRFPGFEGEWEETTLGKCSSDIDYGMNAAAMKFDGENRYIRITDIDESSSTYKSAAPVSPNAPLLDKYLVQQGDILFARTGASTGRTYLYNDNDGKLYFAGFLIRARISKDFSAGFIFRQTQTLKYDKWIKLMSMRSGQPGINSQEYGSFKFNIPTAREQDKISSFLLVIDSRIQTQNKIIKELNVLKATVAKRIFSKQLRFKDDDGNDFLQWKYMKLGDIGKVKMCRRIFNDETSFTGEIPFFKIGSFGREADAFISKELYINYRNKFSFPKKGDILISAAGTIGRTVVYNGEDAYYQDSNIVWIDNDNTIVINEFLYYILQTVKYNTEGGTIQRLYNSILRSIKFDCPTVPEQRKITNFLLSIDSKINVENQLLKKLELQKFFLLNQMFV